MKTHKIKITYSKYEHEYRAWLMVHWFSIWKINFYTAADYKRGSDCTIKRQIKAWRDLYGAMPIDNNTTSVFE